MIQVTDKFILSAFVFSGDFSLNYDFDKENISFVQCLINSFFIFCFADSDDDNWNDYDSYGDIFDDDEYSELFDFNPNQWNFFID